MRTHRFIAALVLLAVAVALPVVDATPSLAATRLSVSPTNPVSREYIKIGGRFGTSVRRPVQLQYWTGSRWATLAKKTTTSAGRFAFLTRAKAPARKFRAVAPRYGRYRAATTAARTVRTVRPTARMSFVPAPVGQAKANTSQTNLTPFSTRFTPVRKGRKVLLQRYSGGAWRTVASSRQAGNGTSQFMVPASLGRNYRGVTVASKGAAAVKSKSQTARHLRAGFTDNFSGDLSKWEIRMPGKRIPGRDCSISSPKSVSVGGGTLKLETKRISPYSGKEDNKLTLTVDESKNPDYATNISCPDGQFYNGHISSVGPQKDMKHGFMAARIKLQPQRGHHGGFWSQPTNGADSTGSEIDTLEYFGDNYPKQIIQHSVYRGSLYDRVQKDRRYLLGSGYTWSNSFHIFSVQWTPKVYIFRIDGVETFRTSKLVSQTDQHIILSLLSSGWEVGALPETGALHPMVIDWVRTWEY